jgi:hypothetical protein
MRDDLFEFLAAQEAGRAAQKAERATEHKRPAEIRSIIDKIKGKTQIGRTAEVRACLTERV